MFAPTDTRCESAIHQAGISDFDEGSLAAGDSVIAPPSDGVG